MSLTVLTKLTIYNHLIVLNDKYNNINDTFDLLVLEVLKVENMQSFGKQSNSFRYIRYNTHTVLKSESV